MKAINLFIISVLFVISMGFAPSGKKEAKAKRQLEMVQLVESGKFRFEARSANSNLGSFNNLSAGYDLVFDSLQVKAHLPYYGRAYSAPYGSNKGGVNFALNAEKIERTFDERKKLFSISTELKEHDDSYSIRLSIGVDGYANLRIVFRNRQPISYSGVIEKLVSSNE